MASNMFYSPEHRPDPAHWTRTNVGLTSPLWWPFLMAAGAGAAWWTYTNWSRIASSSWTGDLQRLGADGDGNGTPQPEPLRTANASLEQSLGVQGASAPEAAEIGDAEMDDGSDAIDAAYAANLGPVPAPRKRSAGKKSAAKATTKAAAKAPAKKAAAKKTASRAPAKKTAAGKAPAKKAAAKKSPSRRR